MNLAGLAGEVLLKNGAEISRVQETVQRILQHLDYPRHNIFVISNGIFITVNEGEEDSCNLVRYVPIGSVHLGRIDEVNEIARSLVEERVSPEKAYKELQKLNEKGAEENKVLYILASGIGAAAFCYMLGGSLIDTPYAFILGLLLQISMYLYPKQMPPFLKTVCGSFVVTVGSALCRYMVGGVHFDALVIGAIIPLVPGVSFTTSIREFFNGDYLSGIIHLVNSLITGICIAAGVGIALKLIGAVG